LADAKVKNEAANAKVVQCLTRAKKPCLTLSRRSTKQARTLKNRLKIALTPALIRENGIAAREAALSKAEADLKANQDSLDARIKAFQAKVAALSA
jgi:hypothetical protein